MGIAGHGCGAGEEARRFAANNQSPGALSWAAYFAPTDPTGQIVYSLDAVYGVTVLRLNGPGAGTAPTVTAPILSAWTAPIPGTAPSTAFEMACLLRL